MRILITGSNGFIGKYLSSYYRELGHRVFEGNRENLNLLDTNAVNEFFNQNYFDLVLHCALVGRDRIYELKQSTNNELIDQNMLIWENLKRNKHRFRRLINFGSGYEFDPETNIDLAQESDIFHANPQHSYAIFKNTIAKDVLSLEEFYTLRFFGVFHYSESIQRFFKKLYAKSKQEYHIFEDRFFDYFNLEDVVPMIDIIMEGQAKHKDINLVYKEKYQLSDMAYQFNDITLSQAKIIVDKTSNNNYTGDYTNFYSYNTPKMGLQLGWLRY